LKITPIALVVAFTLLLMLANLTGATALLSMPAAGWNITNQDSGWLLAGKKKKKKKSPDPDHGPTLPPDPFEPI
jgi:hypothetical protein